MPDNSRKAKKSSKYPLIEICHNTSCRSRGGAEVLLHDIEDLCQGRVKVKSRVCLDHCGKGPNMTLTRSAHDEIEEIIGVDSFGKVVKYIEDVTEHKLLKNDKKLGLFKYEYRRAKHDYDKVTFLSEAISFVRENKDAAALAGLLVLRAEYFLEKYPDSALKDAEKAILLEPSLKEGYAVLARALAACGQFDEAKSTLLSAEELGLSKDRAHHTRKKIQAIGRKSTRSLHNSDVPAIADWAAMTKDAKEKSKIAKAEEERKKSEKAAQEEEGSRRDSKNGVKTVPLTLKANNYGIESNMPPDGPVKRVDMIDIMDLAFYAAGGPVSLCRCYKSKNFPFCDGSHNVHNEETKDNAGPVIIKRNAPKSDCSVLHSEEEKTKIVNGPRANNYGVISNMPPDKPCKRVDILDLCTVKEIVAEEGVARLCRCYASSKFPFCDGSHDCHNAERNDNAGPIVFKCLQPKREMGSQKKTSPTEKTDIRGSNVNLECDKDSGNKGICVQEEATQVEVAKEITRGDDVVLRDRAVPISGNLHGHEEDEQRARISNGPSNGRCLFTGLCYMKGNDAFDGEG